MRDASKSYQQVKRDLLKRGINIRRWAIAHHLPAASVYAALNRSRNGVKAHQIRNTINRFLYGQ